MALYKGGSVCVFVCEEDREKENICMFECMGSYKILR